MKHICIFLAFNNLDDIKTSFESISNNENIDFFIIENKSNNSDEIRNYFLGKNLVGYIQFIENISATAIDIFLRDFNSFLNEYDIITITDGDFYLYDSESMFKEIINNLFINNVMISSCGLYLENNYSYPNPIIGIDKYIDNMNNRKVENGYNIGMTGYSFITFKKENLFIYNNTHCIDTIIYNKIISLGKIWVQTKNNQAYHLTWDSYREGNPYFTWKKQVYPQIWDVKQEVTYNKII